MFKSESALMVRLLGGRLLVGVGIVKVVSASWPEGMEMMSSVPLGMTRFLTAQGQ